MDKESLAAPIENRELSWLEFNGRILDEASDPGVPLYERLNFLSIFSSNLDEFFRVRVASLRSLLRLGDDAVSSLGFNPVRLLYQIHDLVSQQQERFGRIFRTSILPRLQDAGITFQTDLGVTDEQLKHLERIFDDFIREKLEVAQFSDEASPPFLKNGALYLVVSLWPETHDVNKRDKKPAYVLVSVPSPPVRRFFDLPGPNDTHRIFFIDDVIRYNLPRVIADREVGKSYAVKLSRDANLQLEDEFSGDLVEMIRKGLARRERGIPSRLLYDNRAPFSLLAMIRRVLRLEEEDMFAGGKYHNLSDLRSFPRIPRTGFSYDEWPRYIPKGLLAEKGEDPWETVAQSDVLVCPPYHDFQRVTRFLAHAVADPSVTAIWATLYRVAPESAIVGQLIRAARSGKRVRVFVELKAKFDERSNIGWVEKLRTSGAKVFISIERLKVHAKLMLVERKEGTGIRHYAYLSTGNFNEISARVYADLGVFTASDRITRDVRRVFEYLTGERNSPGCMDIMVAPKTLRHELGALIAFEKEEARKGNPAGIRLKLNALEDEQLIGQLYEASRAGVPIDAVVRGICCLLPGLPGISENIRIVRLVDRFLEHGRIYEFVHGGEHLLFLASADWMTRNMDRRVEYAAPMFDNGIRKHLKALLDIQLGQSGQPDRFGRDRIGNIGAAYREAQRAFHAYVGSQLSDGVTSATI